ncbi:hypothetical protein [Hyphobacterium sp.]|jgi:hypothetical protein|uniref:hypothetical protein n=1 Tax=Hyphobacterium sp. TaxID=2004662 RepID=UPI003BA9A48E
MKLLAGVSVAALMILIAALCPQHIRAQAQEAVEIPPELKAEVARQIDLFVAVMEGDRPEIDLHSEPSR